MVTTSVPPKNGSHARKGNKPFPAKMEPPFTRVRSNYQLEFKGFYGLHERQSERGQEKVNTAKIRMYTKHDFIIQLPLLLLVFCEKERKKGRYLKVNEVPFKR